MSENQVKVGVGVLVFKDGQVLMGKRLNAHGDGEYCGPGGHLEFMETIEDCAKRETMEEVGIEIQNLRVLCTTNMRRYGSHHYIDVGVVADWKSGEVQNMEPHKRESWEWYDPDNLPTPLFGVEHIYFEALKTGQAFFEDVDEPVLV